MNAGIYILVLGQVTQSFAGTFLAFLLLYAVEANVLRPKCPAQGIAKFSSPANPQQFYLCENGVVTLKICDQNGLFDAHKSECVHSIDDSYELASALQDTFITGNEVEHEESVQKLNTKGQNVITADNKFQCPDKEIQNYPYPDDCKKYYHCHNGTYEILTCPEFFLFDTKTRVCQLLLVSSCYNHTTELPPVHTTVGPICPQDKTEDFPCSSDCHEYYHCENGTRELRTCPWFYSFDIVQMKCRFYIFAKCSNEEIKYHSLTDYWKYGSDIKVTKTNKKQHLEIDLETAKLKMANNISKRETQHAISKLKLNEKEVNKTNCKFLTSNNDEFTCTKNGVYDCVYSKNCHQYYHCNNRSLSVESCPQFQNFDPDQFICRWSCLVACQDASSTPVAISTTAPTTSITEPATNMTVYIVTEETDPPIPIIHNTMD